MSPIWLFAHSHFLNLKRLQLITPLSLMIILIGIPWCLQGQEPVRVVRPVAPLDRYDPVRFPSLEPVQPHFEWAMKPRFGLDANHDGLIDYDYSLCYLHPESYQFGAACPKHPWVVTFDATGTSGRNPPFSFDWIIPGDVQCNSPIAARIDHTATLLPNGKVLIAGGRSINNAPLASAELYDPVAGIVFSTVSMTVGRVGHTATLLQGGKVLIAGGAAIGAGGELYDPATGAFSSTTGYMSSRRANHTATLLPSGKVLIAGGSYSGQRFSTAELYDPATGNFSPTGNMTAERERHTATLLQNGKVLIAGGGYGAELYDPGAGTFSATGGESTFLSVQTATLLPTGKVLLTVAGAAAQLYNPSSNTFSPTAGSMTARVGHTAILLQDGQVLIAGGLSGTTTLTTAELYDPALNTFSPTTGSMSLARKYYSATLLRNGKVLIAGGVSDTAYLTTAEVYDPTGGSFGPPEIKNIAVGLRDSDPFVDSPIISCAFAKQDKYTVTLRVKDTAGNIRSITNDAALKDLLIVSIGDSVASGEGNPDRSKLFVVCFSESDCISKLHDRGATQWQIDRKACVLGLCVVPAQWQDRQCDRSFNSGPARAAWSIERLDPHTSVTFLHLACSGAGIRGSAPGLLEPYQGQNVSAFFCPNDPVAGICTERINLQSNSPVLNKCGVRVFGVLKANYCLNFLPPQVDQVARYLCPEPLGSDASGHITKACSSGKARKIDALVMSVGANDLAFGPIVKACGVFLDCNLRFSQRKYPPELNDLIRPVEHLNDRLSELPDKYDDLKKSIDEKLKVSNVYITQYHDPTRDGGGKYCNPALANFREYAHSVEIKGWLNKALSDITEALAATVDFKGLTPGELSWAIDSFFKPLNGHIKQAAGRNGWNYVHGFSDMLQGTVSTPGPEDFFYHGICAGDQKWVVGLQASYDNQGDLNGPLHPNFGGQHAYQTALVDAITKNRAELAPIQARLPYAGSLSNLIAHPTLGFRGLSVGIANQPPKANAGPDQTVRLGSLVTVNGSGSSDQNAGPSSLSFSWAQTAGPAAALTPASMTAQRFTFAPSVEGNYEFSLLVNDGQNNSQPDSVTIKVPLLGDIDLDGDVDKNDLKLIRKAMNKPSSCPNDLCDLDGDGKISASDEQMLKTLCTRPKCASN